MMALKSETSLSLYFGSSLVVLRIDFVISATLWLKEAKSCKLTWLTLPATLFPRSSQLISLIGTWQVSYSYLRFWWNIFNTFLCQSSNMEYSLLCREAGFDCSHVIKGNSEEETLNHATRHAQETHGMQPQDISPELTGKLRSLIKQT
jgi:predicted small metal-binding protein